MWKVSREELRKQKHNFGPKSTPSRSQIDPRSTTGRPTIDPESTPNPSLLRIAPPSTPDRLQTTSRLTPCRLHIDLEHRRRSPLDLGCPRQRPMVGIGAHLRRESAQQKPNGSIAQDTQEPRESTELIGYLRIGPMSQSMRAAQISSEDRAVQNRPQRCSRACSSLKPRCDATEAREVAARGKQNHPHIGQTHGVGPLCGVRRPHRLRRRHWLRRHVLPLAPRGLPG